MNEARKDPPASEAWQDVKPLIVGNERFYGVGAVERARAADAQQIEWFQKRTAWYDQQIAALRAEKENLEGQHAIDLQNARLLIEQVEAAEAQLTALQAELKAADDCYRVQGDELLRHIQIAERLQAEQAQWQQKVTRFCDAMAKWSADERGSYDGLIAVACSGWTELAALAAQQEKPVE